MKRCEKCDKDVNPYLHVHCPKCDSPPEEHELIDYDPMWHEGEIWCMTCRIKVRNYDAG